MADHRAADHGAADHGAADHGAADHGAADHGAADHGAADHGAAGYGAAGHRAADHRAWRGLVGALLAAALLPLNSTMIALALPDIAREFDAAGDTVAQTLVATYLVAAIVLQSPGGKLGDRLGQWRVLALGAVVMAAGAVLGYLAPSLGVLAVARVLVAAGGAFVVPAAVALIRSELPAERRGRAFGAFGSVMSLAAGAGPIVGGELVSAFGWRSVFVVNLPILALSAVLLATARPAAAAAAPDRPRFDWPGTALLAVLLTAFVAGLELSGVVGAALLVGSLALLVPFVWLQRRAADPVVAPWLFRSRSFTAGSLLVALQNLTLYTLVIELPLLLHVLLAVDSAETGRLLVFLMVATVLVSPVAGRLIDRFGSRPVAIAGSLVCLAGLALLAASSLATLGSLRVPLLLLGAGLGLTMPAAQHASLSGLDRRDSGMAAGVGSTMRYLGGVVGVGLLGQLLELTGDRAEILAGHRTLLAVFAGALLAGLVCAVLLPGRPSGHRLPGSPDEAGTGPVTPSTGR